jgi:hypothetical protein
MCERVSRSGASFLFDKMEKLFTATDFISRNGYSGLRVVLEDLD